jgi:hypothetical protein
VPALLRDSGDASPNASGGPSSAAPPTVRNSDGGTPSVQNSPEPAKPAPAGWRLHRDPSGFSIAVPVGWQESREGSLVEFRDPDSDRFLRVDQRAAAGSDPYEDWLAQQPSVSRQLPGYRDDRIRPLRYRGWPAADWEYIWGRPGSLTHVLNRNVVPNDDRAYALYFSTPHAEWERDRAEYFTVFVETFSPAP